ncbi:MAG: twin-arginine translocase TatA/TatE family subunit [Bacteroidetes bacterium]|nr:twin-arginine translocase TatA/TatE family subunit [Bacteroidota bacterium]
MISSILLFLNLGGGEVFIIVLVIIMLFGSDKLPGLAKGIGKGLREINDAKNQIQNEIQRSTSGIRVADMGQRYISE